MKHKNRDKFRKRLDSMFTNIPEVKDDSIQGTTYLHSVWSKHLCVLVSGYLEQSMKELVFEFCDSAASPHVYRYVEKTWPKSKNMRWEQVTKVISNLNEEWGHNVNAWFENNDSRKSELNSLIQWRNDISHGKDANTNHLSIPKVQKHYQTIKLLVDHLEELLQLNK